MTSSVTSVVSLHPEATSVAVPQLFENWERFQTFFLPMKPVLGLAPSVSEERKWSARTFHVSLPIMESTDTLLYMPVTMALLVPPVRSMKLRWLMLPLHLLLCHRRTRHKIKGSTAQTKSLPVPPKQTWSLQSTASDYTSRSRKKNLSPARRRHPIGLAK